MKNKMKRFLSILLSFALVLGLMPGMSLTAYAADPVSYMEASWNSESNKVEYTEKTCTDYYVIDSTTTYTTLTDGKWYVVKGDVNNRSYFTLSEMSGSDGVVNLILCDGATLTVPNGIAPAKDSNWTLNIYAQSAGTGTLTCTASGNGAAIGGKSGSKGINVNILNSHSKQPTWRGHWRRLW